MDYHFYGCILLLTLFAISSSQDIRKNPCYEEHVGYIRRDPEDCSKYITCIGYGAQRVQNCPAGLFFNLNRLVCDHSFLVDCKNPRSQGTTQQDVFPNKPLPQHKPVPVYEVPNSEHRMVHSVHSEIPHRYITPFHTGPPQSPRHPTVPDSPHHQTYHQVRLEPGVPSCNTDGLYADPSDCSWYVQCAGGRVYRKPCPTGTYFSHQSGHCGYYKDMCRGDYAPVIDHPVEKHFPINPKPQNSHPVKPEPVHETYIVENEGFSRQPSKEKDPNHYLAGDELMSAVKEYVNRRGMQDAQEMVAETMRDEARMATVNSRKRTTFSSVATFLGATPYTKQLSLPASVQLQFLHNVRDRFDLNKVEMQDIMEVIPSILNPSQVMMSPDMSQPNPSMDTCPYPMDSQQNKCDINSLYRTIDGSCNNLNHPVWGKSFMAFKRFLPTDYADGIDSPRQSQSGNVLPSARKVSLTIFEDKDRPSHVHTTLFVTFGQFTDHDLTRTSVTKLSMEPLGSGKMTDVSCGETECETEGAENKACLPIDVDKHDPDFGGKQCLMFVRTQEVLREDCSLGPREQLNQVTSYLDASHIYGSNMEQIDRLREKSNTRRGRMRVTQHPKQGFKPLLPQIENEECRDLNSTIQCFDAGDERANEQVGLAALHTMWLRYHNSIEDQLHRVNPHWNGEKLFQETRKIVNAVWQHTVFNEFLPLALGPSTMQKYALNLVAHGYADSYDAHTSAGVANAFATAAFRFGHTMIDNSVSFAGPNYKERSRVDLSTVMVRPLEMYEVDKRAPGSGVDSLMHGALSQPSQTPDQFFGKQITTRLFSMNPPNMPGMDLAALNIQRGRDHGIQGYNAWRKWCNLRVAQSFDDLVDIPVYLRDRMRRLYKHVNDIDLFPGAIIERILPGATVGPTFACIIGRQFRDLKVGDRFWYERNNRDIGFSSAQLASIKKMTISSVVCNSCDRVDTIQKFALLQPMSQALKTLGRHNYAEAYSLASLYRGENNERVSCSDLPVLDMSAWRERRPRYRK